MKSHIGTIVVPLSPIRKHVPKKLVTPRKKQHVYVFTRVL